MRYAAENITSADDNVTLMVGVDTGVFHGFVNCGATGAITGIGNVLPKEVQHLVALSKAAATGDVEARKLALELEAALDVLSSFDEGPDLVLFYKHMMVLTGNPEYELHFNETDKLSDSQRGYCETQLKLFQTGMRTGASRAVQRRNMPPEIRSDKKKRRRIQAPFFCQVRIQCPDPFP